MNNARQAAITKEILEIVGGAEALGVVSRHARIGNHDRTVKAEYMAATGKVVQVLGNVVDVEFTAETLPKINDALTCTLASTRRQARQRRRRRRRHRARRHGDGRRAIWCSKCRASSATTKCAASRWVRPTVWCAARPVTQHRRADHGSGRRRHARPHLQRARQDDRLRRRR